MILSDKLCDKLSKLVYFFDLLSMTFFNQRIAGLALGMSILFILLAGVTRIEIFPCLGFVWDSDQGFYYSTCALIDEDGESLIGGDYISGYEPVPIVWTWVMMAGVFLVLPYGIAVVGNHWWTHRKK